MKTNMKFDAIFIDVDDTILDFTKCSHIAIKRCFSDFNYSIGKQFDAFFTQFMTLNSQLWQKVELGFLEKSQLHNTRFNLAFSQFGICGLDGIEFEKRYRVHLATTHEIVSGAPQLLEYLSSRYPLFIASNAPHEQQIVRLTRANLIQYFTDIYTSELLNSEKPKREFFEISIKLASDKLGFNLLPSRIAMIGDSLSADVVGSQNIGMTAIWFNIYNKSNHDGYNPDYEIKSLLDTMNVL